MSPLTLIITALLAAMVAFGVLFFIARRIDNFGIVDVAWALGFAPIAVFYGYFGAGAPERRWLIAAMAVLWSFRLGGYLGWRVLGHIKTEDGRYRQLRKEWGDDLNRKMFRFFQFQAVLLVLLTGPFLIAVSDPSPGIRVVEWLGAAVWLVALIGETVADLQLASFRRNPANKGRVCDTGLWCLSRHPNYFFEWLVWVAFATVAIASPFGWLALTAPALMLFFLLKVTGIRYTEEQLLRSKGEDYRAYCQRTNAFIPWFPRKSSS